MSTGTYRLLSTVCFVMGFVSIFGSIALWMGYDSVTAVPGHGERTAIFVGLWAPTFYILSERFRSMSTESKPLAVS